jgi:hypothetical protein
MDYSNVKFYAQRDRHNCGPIAILNAMKWCSIKCSYKNDLKGIIQYCHTENDGTYDCYLEKAVKYFLNSNATVRKYKKLSKKRLVKYLENDNYSVIVGHKLIDVDYEHFSFWFDFKEDYVYAANYIYKENISKFNIKDIPKISSIYLIKKKY